MIRLLNWLSLAWLPAFVWAQSEVVQPDFKVVTQTVDLSLATKGSLTTAALSINRQHGQGYSHRFRIGYGLRLTSAGAVLPTTVRHQPMW